MRPALLAVLLLAAPAANAQTAAGSDSFDFLTLDAGARPVAMGGAYTALAADANALRYNPAGLAGVSRSEASFTHNQYVQDVAQESLSVALEQGWGLDVNYVGWGNVARNTISSPDGTGGSFGVYDLAVTGGYGRAFGPLSLGAAAKVIQEKLDDVTATGYAFDLGALYAVEGVKGLTFGAALQNLGPNVRFNTVSERLPALLRAGAGYGGKLYGQKFALGLDASKTRDDKTRFGAGAETVISGVMPIRAGFTTRNDAGVGVTAGVGFVHGGLAVDYAFEPYGALGSANRFTLTYRWGSTRASSN